MLQLYIDLASSRLARHAIQPIQLYSYTALYTVQPDVEQMWSSGGPKGSQPEPRRLLRPLRSDAARTPADAV